eukprot:CAMPEP_0170249868 /NCGR_PEP_ID=MMETSP0116_2-20130129/24744_1 /TAXON_ID=400756 /ORGANISM="Durinskia baltica, Strain CSIRO CS-38" /LENGTH=49 /DNA_ID= /DNA_START= /DNA_END= /DNA_ORIENTATION=
MQTQNEFSRGKSEAFGLRGNNAERASTAAINVELGWVPGFRRLLRAWRG